MKEIIRVENLSKAYRVGQREQTQDTLFGQIADIIKSPVRNLRNLRNLTRFNGNDDPTVHWALKDINFTVNEGEVLGIIGHNGAGKSTLLKILSRVTEPTSGRIRLRGRIGALLEVGTGFHPELTGRENIYMNGTILGMTKKEIDRKLYEIIDFAGVEKFIDTPVKFYSSGMKVRLGFAVAAHLEPEILVIDEVLAVGDSEFQKKCLGKMEDVSKNSGRTLLFVSHNMAAIQTICQRVLVLKNGLKEYDGDIITGINIYFKYFTSDNSMNNENDNRFVINYSADDNGLTLIEYNKPFEIRIKLKSFNSSNYSFYLIIRNSANENIVHEQLDRLTKDKFDYNLTFKFPPLWIRPGIYNYHFKIISLDVNSNIDRYVSTSYTLKVIGETEVSKMIGILTPEIDITK